jgi:type I restriction enzyme S subunit
VVLFITPTTCGESRFFSNINPPPSRAAGKEISESADGIVKDRNRLYWDQFKEMPSLVPPPEEQRKIVAYIDHISADNNGMTNKVCEAIDILREYRTALISAAVTGKIDVTGEACK